MITRPRGALLIILALAQPLGCAMSPPAPMDSRGARDDRGARDSVEDGGDAQQITGPHEMNPPRAGTHRPQVPDGAMDGGGALPGGDDRARMQQAIRQLERRLEPYGGSVRDGRPRASLATPTPRTCPQTCTIAQDICTSRAAICRIAHRHPAEPQMQQQCRWADGECEGAQLLCSRCQP